MSTEPVSGRHFLPARRALADDVYDAVLGLLMDQVLEPGSRVSIDGLARELNVSPTPVREALARLESEGLVLKRPLKGYTAAPLLDADGLQQLFEMRRLMEPYAASRAAGSLDAETLEELEELCAAMVLSGQLAQTGDDRFRDYKDFAEQDADFHRIIAEHCGNTLLTDAIERLRSHLHQYRIYFRHGVVGETSGEHEAVLAALREGDAKKAERAMLKHLTSSYRRISSSLADGS
ncbi:MAG TPA: GntR family transcriptional regulator [Gryllotalpicola sp.]